MADNRQGGYGSTMTIGGAAMVHIQDFEFPEFEKVLAEITAHDSPGGYAEHIDTGKRRLNSFSITVTWDRTEASHDAVQDAFDATEPVELVIADPTGIEEISFDAHISQIGRTSEQEEGFQAEIEIQPTGIPDIVVTTPT